MDTETGSVKKPDFFQCALNQGEGKEINTWTAWPHGTIDLIEDFGDCVR